MERWVEGPRSDGGSQRADTGVRRGCLRVKLRSTGTRCWLHQAQGAIPPRVLVPHSFTHAQVLWDPSLLRPALLSCRALETGREAQG